MSEGDTPTLAKYKVGTEVWVPNRMDPKDVRLSQAPSKKKSSKTIKPITDVPDPFLKGVILAIDDLAATVRTVSDPPKVLQLDLIARPLMVANPEVVSDMCSLYHIHDPGILHNLEQRSYGDFPYTFMGSVMVAVNPLKPTPLEGVECGSDSVLTAPPHPYAVAETAYQQMTFQGSRLLAEGVRTTQRTPPPKPGTRKKKTLVAGEVVPPSCSQSVVVSGESGAGKTESAKMVLAHLVARPDDTSIAALDSKLIDTNPILEAFGNAQTLRNHNSSRFGKFMKLMFTGTEGGKKWILDGATVETYLLERSRITFHQHGERTFHIFYMLLRGSDEVLKKACSFDGDALDQFVYTTAPPPFEGQPVLDGPAAHELKGKTAFQVDQENFNELVQAFKSINIDDLLMKNLFQVIAAIMHLGNVDFVDKETPEGDVGSVNPKGRASKGLDRAAHYLGLSEDALVKLFVERTIKTPDGDIVTKRNARGAGFAREAVSKALYSRVFEWLLLKIRGALYTDLPMPADAIESFIGVLDIFGFESFAINGFEQLLINFTNEALQGTFNRQVFVAEAALYEKEGLFDDGEGFFGRPVDNSACIELLQGVKGKKTTGLLMLIDAAASGPDPSDSKMNNRMHQTFNKHPCFLKPHPKDVRTTFIIRHYAGAVRYTIGSFLEQNNDRLPAEVESLFAGSSDHVVAKCLFAEVTSGAAVNAAPKRRRKPPARSVVRKFQNQMRELIDALESTRSTFIRCVKPNAAMMRDPSQQTWFDRQYVFSQLQALNIPQTAEVLKKGFPTRMNYTVLEKSFLPIIPKDALKWHTEGDPKSAKSFVSALFYAFEIPSESFKLGHTKAFFRAGKLAELDMVLQAAKDDLSADVVKRFKYYYVRSFWRRAIAKGMAAAEFFALFAKARARSDAASLINALLRGAMHRLLFDRQRRGAVFAQKHYRGRIGRRLAAKRREEVMEEERLRIAKLKEEGKRREAEEQERIRNEREETMAREAERVKAQEEAAEALIEAQKERAAEEKAKDNAKRRQSMAPTKQKFRRASHAGGQSDHVRFTVVGRQGLDDMGAIQEEEELTIFQQEAVAEEVDPDVEAANLDQKLREEKIQQLWKLMEDGSISLEEFQRATTEIAKQRKHKFMKMGNGEVVVDANAIEEELEEKEAELDFQSHGVITCTRCGEVNIAYSEWIQCRKCGKLQEALSDEDRAAKKSDAGDSTNRRRKLSVLGLRRKKYVETLPPLQHPLCNLPYSGGKFSCELQGAEKQMDVDTFEEYIVYMISCRFIPAEGREVAWRVGQRFKKWRHLHDALAGTPEIKSPLSKSAQKKLPEFPKKKKSEKLRGVKSKKVVAQRQKDLHKYLKGFFDMIASGFKGKKAVKKGIADEIAGWAEDDDVPPPPPAMPTEEWETVRNPDGDLFWINLVTGETAFEEPSTLNAAVPPPPGEPSAPLPPGWEEIVDEDDGEVYYYNAETDESSWTRPQMTVEMEGEVDPEKVLSMKVVSQFFELRRNVARSALTGDAVFTL